MKAGRGRREDTSVRVNLTKLILNRWPGCWTGRGRLGCTGVQVYTLVTPEPETLSLSGVWSERGVAS